MQLLIPSGAVSICLLTSLAAIPAHACLNDRDTARTEQLNALSIKDENAGVRNAARILTGRFERNPPAYYQARIARLKNVLRSNPGDIDTYDDIAVAYDRLGNDSNAIAWIEGKRKRLEQNGGARSANMPEALKERWYRYFANIGTFRVHQWVRQGGDAKQIAAVKQSRDEIAEALKLKPHAHFGREAAQLRVLKWIVDVQAVRPLNSGDTAYATLGNSLDGPRRDPLFDKGLVGLIELGGAWESVDVYDAIATLWRDKRPGIALFAAERVRELLASGHHSLFRNLFPDSAFTANADYVESKLTDRPRGAGLAKYRQLRAEAEQWHRNRTAYMEGRMALGLHPDTNPEFWSGWREPIPPSLDLPLSEQVIYTLVQPWVVWPLLWFAGAVTLIVSWRRLRAWQLTRTLPH